MRTVLVCVRTPLAAQTVASAAARLGMSGVVRTAVSETEALLRLAERPADIILADTALTRRDSVGFTRRALVRAPGAVIILFGAEDPRVAAATIAAGARGVLRGGGDHDLVSIVAKALLLCLPEPARPAAARPAVTRAGEAVAVAGDPPPTRRSPPPVSPPPARPTARSPAPSRPRWCRCSGATSSTWAPVAPAARPAGARTPDRAGGSDPAPATGPRWWPGA
ncbi:hypothetical protein Psuf_041420 [Phytohabitans suffuscus]|uniref:Response regulatory domain-containing protein n=1 Tax=Phytohabitans suffuscus TaxID=624315 RepID=A0A6F8YLD0_9ACTN|nr:hypothetical protein Psuf_041420 [Phytohabitans suffuscus]